MSSKKSNFVKKEVNVTAACLINGVQYKCRTCFDPESQVFSLMEKCSDNKTWQDFLNEIAHLKTNAEESLPKTICSKCLDKLINYYDFLLQIQNVNKKYSELLANLNAPQQDNVPKRFENFKEYFTEPAISTPLDQFLTEIKLEEEKIVPFDIAAGSKALSEEKDNSLENKGDKDRFEDTSIDDSDLSCEEFLDEKRSLHEAETTDNFKSDQNESSSSSDEEDEYLPGKRRKTDKPTSSSSYKIYELCKMQDKKASNTNPISPKIFSLLNARAAKSKILNGEVIVYEKQGKSKVWDVFGLLKTKSGEEIPDVVVCRICLNVFKCIKMSTSNLIKHKCYKDSNLKREIDAETTESFLNILTEWTIEDCMPFKIVQDSGFFKVAECLLNIGAKFGRNADITTLLHDPTTVLGKIAKKYERRIRKVKSELTLNKQNGFGLTSGIWKDDYLKKSYLSLTIHYIKKGKLMSRLLGMKCLDTEKYTSEKINTKICTILKEFDLELNNKVIMVTDHGSSLIAAFRRDNHIYCINNLLHDAVQKSMQDVSAVVELSQKCIKLIKYLYGTEFNLNLNTTLNNFSPKRWSFIYSLFNSIKANWPDILKTLQERNEMNRVHRINLNEITAIIEVLEPFNEALIKLGEEKDVTLYLVFMMVHYLQRKCICSCSDLKIATHLKEQLSAHLKSTVIQNLTIYHKIAVFLFPPANKLYKFSENEKAEIKEACKKIMVTYLKKSPEVEQQNEVHAEQSMEKYYFDYIQKPQNPSFDFPVEYEIANYEIVNVINFLDDFNVLQWWELHKNDFPLLYKLSCQILATPATSLDSERAFSAARKLISEKQCLNDDMIESITFLHSNIKKNKSIKD